MRADHPGRQTVVITSEQLQHIYGCNAMRAAMYLEPLNAGMAEFKIDTPTRIAAFLAQLGEESARLIYVEEIATGDAYNGRENLGNTKPDAYKWAGAALPGPYFKGHGLIQITGFNNHQACGIDLYPDDPAVFLREPRRLCQPGDAARSAAWFWAVGAGKNLSHAARAHGLQVGCNLNDVADAGDFLGVTLAINGGLNGQNDRLFLWSKAKSILIGEKHDSGTSIAAADPGAGLTPGSSITGADVERALRAAGVAPD